MTQNRLRYFDTIKGVAIFLVVMGHVLTMCIRDIDQAFSFKMIGHIHMPLFFFISGYFTYKEKNGLQYILPNLKQRFLQLIVPVLVTGSLWVIYFPHSGLSSPFLHGFTGFWTDLWKNGYWFTLALFQILLIYSFLTIILKRQKKIISQLITIGITWFLIIIFNRLIPEYYDKIIGISWLTHFFPIFMIGVMAKKYHNTIMSAINTDLAMTLCLLIASIALYIQCYPWEFEWIKGGVMLVIKIILHISVAIIAIICARSWENHAPSKMFNLFSYIGRESLSIYLLHYFFLFPLSFLQDPLRDMGLGFVPTVTIAAVVASIVIAIVLGVNYIISHSRLLRLLLVGKL